MLSSLLLKLFVYGHLGFLIEIWFTGLHSLIFNKDLRGRAVTYLPMFLIYGTTALILENVSEALPWPFYFKAFVYIFIIYFAEGFSGWVLKKTTGRIPWDYGLSRWTPFGLINLSYVPFWFLLALSFDIITHAIYKIVVFVSSQM
jgi:hypothetical protein